MGTQSRCDFVVEKDNVFSKVQVKTATWSRAGPFKYLQVRLSSSNKNLRKYYTKEDFDLLAVADGNRLWIAPFSQIEGKTSLCLESTNPNYSKYKKGKDYNPADWACH